MTIPSPEADDVKAFKIIYGPYPGMIRLDIDAETWSKQLEAFIKARELSRQEVAMLHELTDRQSIHISDQAGEIAALRERVAELEGCISDLISPHNECLVYSKALIDARALLNKEG